MEQPDHPHRAAVRLMQALRCCRRCHQPSEALLLELRQLEYRKQLLAEELHALTLGNSGLPQLRAEVAELEALVGQLRAENEEAARLGEAEVARMGSERQQWELQQQEAVARELEREGELGRELGLELESLTERIRSLNRVNNQLIYSFCSP